VSNPAHNDEELLAQLLRQAGDPRVAPDPQHVEKLRATILARLASTQATADGTDAAGEADFVAVKDAQGTRTMKYAARIAMAATVLAAMGPLAYWLAIGGSNNLAFAAVAKALDNVRTATFDETTEVKDPISGKHNTYRSNTLFRAPGCQRCEMSMPVFPGKEVRSIMILDLQAMKGLTLMPEQKQATTIDLSKLQKPKGGSANMFEMVRQLLREGSSGGGAKAESLGKKEIDGRAVVGFRTRSNLADMTLWVDPQTARPVRVELDSSADDLHGIMSNFRYDMDLDPALFSLEPPAGYTVNNMQAAMPVEEDLVNLLRLIAEHNKGLFPPAIGTNKESMEALQANAKAEAERFVRSPEGEQLAKKLRAKFGKDRDGYMKAWMEEVGPKAAQKHMQGMMFYKMLQPENDSHYAGKDVKLGTPDRPIFWYKPTGSEKYHVIYADLSVKQLAPEEAQRLTEAKSK
jgi:outer membrane lipoprotein-sorting protein